MRVGCGGTLLSIKDKYLIKIANLCDYNLQKIIIRFKGGGQPITSNLINIMADIISKIKSIFGETLENKVIFVKQFCTLI